MRFFCVACGFGIVVAALNFFSPNLMTTLLQQQSVVQANKSAKRIVNAGDSVQQKLELIEPPLESVAQSAGDHSPMLEVGLTRNH